MPSRAASEEPRFLFCGSLMGAVQPVAGDSSRVVLLGLSHVDQLDVALLHQLGDLLRGVVVHRGYFHLIEQPTGLVSGRATIDPDRTASRASRSHSARSPGLS